MRICRILVAAALLIASPAAARTIVVKATGPSASSFPTGKLLRDGAKLKLKAGDRVTVMDARGTRLFVGARNVDLAQTTPTDASFTSLVSRYGNRRSSTGATRGVTRTPGAPSIVSPVAIALAGRQCVVAGSEVALRRSGTGVAAAYTLANRTTGTIASIDFSAEARSAAWPAARLPLASGARYAIGGAGAGGEIELAVIEGKPEDDLAWAELLVKNGCAAQVEALAGL